ncbi:MAG: prolipoprotein diacylglyceryl transferase [Candidatus Sericytochromatia bacterium]
MAIQHNLNPDILHLGPITIRWYGMMYVVGFIIGYYVLKSESKRKNLPYTEEDISDFIFYLMLGVILGGRIGYIIFYNLAYYMANPIKIIAITEGGMSFHGGLIGIILATILYARKKKAKFSDLGDMVALGGALGLGFGRIGNFINGELYGRPVSPDFPLAFIFPADPLKLPRHPSQIYESLTEGFIMFAVLYFLSRKNVKSGTLSGTFLMLYGTFRFFIEFTREPDVQIGLFLNMFSMGQILCLPMIIVGLAIIIISNFSKNKKEELKLAEEKGSNE